MASEQSKRYLAPVMMIRPMPLVVQRQRHHPLSWARAFARCDLAPFRECQNNTHFGSTRTDAKEDRPDQTRQRQIFWWPPAGVHLPRCSTAGTFSPLPGGVFVGSRPPGRASARCKKKKTRCTAVAMYRRSHTHTYLCTSFLPSLRYITLPYLALPYITLHYKYNGTAQHIHTHIYIYIHRHINICVYTHTYIHTYMHTCIHAYMHTCIHAYMHTCIHAYMHTCIHAYMHACMHAGIRLHTSLQRCCQSKCTDLGLQGLGLQN